MLRSLVGSEMCIRDSLLRTSGQGPFPGQYLFAAGTLFGRVAETGGKDTCLLYTSDAADDLLCVDLGGRRIIKKKTQLNYQT